MFPIFFALVSVLPAQDSKPTRPNFVIIYADDLGYGDLGCYGHPTIRTPHLDQMAREGVRFTDFYSAAEVCTPSRAALLTGRYPVRSGMCHDQFRVLRSKSLGHLPESEITLPEILGSQGYETAIIGKWHLGVFTNNPKGHPRNHGFGYYFGLPHSNDMDPAPNRKEGGPGRLDQDPKWWNAPLFRNDKLIEQPADQTSLTARYTEEAIGFLKSHRDKPFFLYLPHTFPHVPLFASEAFRNKSKRGLYGDVVEELDASVGKVLQTLREEGLARNTIVIFSSDNGPWLTMGQAGGSAGLLRDGKGSTWEGGMRVPTIAWGPGWIPGDRVVGDIASTMDLFATFAQMGGAKLPGDRPIDGLDITQVLKGTGPSPRGSMLYYRGQQLFAARLGNFKAHFITRPAYGAAKAEKHERPILYNLAQDPSERFDVAAAHPEVIERIRKLVEDHKKGVSVAPSQLVEAIP